MYTSGSASFGGIKQAYLIPPNKAEVSKVDYFFKDKSSKVHYFCSPIGTVIVKIVLNLVILYIVLQ